jgi:ribose 5-phosphate isomerase B
MEGYLETCQQSLQGVAVMLPEEAVRELVRRVVLRTLGQETGTAQASCPSGQQPAARAQCLCITEADVLAVPQGGRLEVAAGALVTPLARDAAIDRHVALVEGLGTRRAGQEAGKHLGETAQPRVGSAAARTVALGADHGGFRLKEELKSALTEWGYQVADCGTHGTESVDYPDYAYAVARLVADGGAWRGIMVDGAGIGSCMAANKVPGVRAAMCYDHATAVNSREHNDANVLTLGGVLIGPSLARQIVKVWLETPFGGDRHARRVAKISEIERRYQRK